VNFWVALSPAIESAIAAASFLCFALFGTVKMQRPETPPGVGTATEWVTASFFPPAVAVHATVPF